MTFDEMLTTAYLIQTTGKEAERRAAIVDYLRSLLEAQREADAKRASAKDRWAGAAVRETPIVEIK